MFVGPVHAGQRWRDVLGWEDRAVLIDSKGYGIFPVGHRSVGVWTDERASGFDKLKEFVFPRVI